MSDLGLKTPTTLKPRKSKNAIRIPRLIVGVLPLPTPSHPRHRIHMFLVCREVKRRSAGREWNKNPPAQGRSRKSSHDASDSLLLVMHQRNSFETFRGQPYICCPPSPDTLFPLERKRGKCLESHLQ
jgi:hypothetical protein